MIESFSTYFKIKQRTVLVLQKKSQYFKKSDHDFIHQNMNNRLILICFIEQQLNILFLRYLVEVNSYDSTGKLRVFGIYDQAEYPLHVYFWRVELIRSKGIPEKALHKKVTEEKLEFDTCDSLDHKSKDLTWAKIHMETCKQGIFYRRDNVYKEKNIIFAFYTDVSKNQQEHYPKDTLIIRYNLYHITYHTV